MSLKEHVNSLTTRVKTGVGKGFLNFGINHLGAPVLKHACSGFAHGHEQRLEQFKTLKPKDGASETIKLVHEICYELLRVLGSSAKVIAEDSQGTTERLVPILTDDQSFDPELSHQNVSPLALYAMSRLHNVRLFLAVALRTANSSEVRNNSQWLYKLFQDFQERLFAENVSMENYGHDPIVSIIHDFLTNLISAYIRGRDDGIAVAQDILSK